MEIDVKRLWPNSQACTGVVEVDGRQKYFSLEDTVREISGIDVGEWKQAGQTAIPRGRYKVLLQWSERFQRRNPWLQGVPGFVNIEIHGGNTAADTEGCILIGMKRIDDHTIAECAPAVEELTEQIDQANANNEEVWITVG